MSDEHHRSLKEIRDARNIEADKRGTYTAWFADKETHADLVAKKTEPRNTQFAGFAKALHKDLEMLNQHRGFRSVQEAVDANEQIIARRAYDFACHIISSQAQGMDLFGKNDPEWIRERVELIPDMTEFPKDE